MSEKKVCSHCHQSYAKLFEVEIGGEYKAFCCKGCEGVYRFLHEGGYGDFYDLLGDKTLKPPKVLMDLSRAFYLKMIKALCRLVL